MKIANLEFGRYPVFLAPMEDVTDAAFRLMCKEFGADMVYTEFVSSDALIRDVNRSVQKLQIYDKERPVAIQIYGNEVEPMVEAAKRVEAARPDILDINFGCPVKKVARKGAGAGMLQNIPKLLQITKAVVDAVKIPVTVKTRLGWDENSKVIVELTEALQDCGIAALTIHGRTRAQMYTGEADWTLIGKVKENPRITIPIIGNGDITTPKRAKECFERYGVDRIFGFHLWPDLPLGSISSRPGPLLAATSEATFDFHGKASHIGKAADGADSLEASMRWLLEAYDYIAERQKEEPCLFKCGLLQSGQARNVISSRTYVEGSLRTYSDEMGVRCKRDLKEIAERRAAETRSTVEVDFTEGYPPVVNDPELFALAAKHLPELTELPEPLLIAEDFSFYQRHMPGMFTLLGTGTGIPLHADTFNFSEEVLVAGVETYKKLIRIP